MSLPSSSSLASSAMVRTMKPPRSSRGTSPCTRARSASRSTSPSMRCEMPICGSWGRYTSVRPAMLICVDSRAPLVPMGSLMTCTIRAWPSNSVFSMASCAVPFLSGSRGCQMSATCRKAARSRPMSMNADCMPGSTRTTLPR
ncbi:hypothetical protein D3C81_1455730 [compost metagenome]